MATPMRVFFEIAERHGVAPGNERAVEEFFETTVHTLSEKEKEEIRQELFSRESEEER